MRPRPRIRKTIKWGGAAVTVLLVVVWIGSGFVEVRWLGASGDSISVRQGCVSVWSMPGVLASAVGTEWSGPHTWRMQWWVSRRASHSGMVLTIPLWWFAAMSAMGSAAAWWADAMARRRAGANQCVRCGYDLRGLAINAACPECGSGGVSR